MKTCSICQREDVKEINAALKVEGSTIRGVARQFGVGKSALDRHKAHIGTDTAPRTGQSSISGQSEPHIGTPKATSAPRTGQDNATKTPLPATPAPFDLKKRFPIPGTRDETRIRMAFEQLGSDTRNTLQIPDLDSIFPGTISDIITFREKIRSALKSFAGNEWEAP